MAAVLGQLRVLEGRGGQPAQAPSEVVSDADTLTHVAEDLAAIYELDVPAMA